MLKQLGNGVQYSLAFFPPEIHDGVHHNVLFAEPEAV